jgi:methylphosphotriester-DNA--protein-cysteine methyltransferase
VELPSAKQMNHRLHGERSSVEPSCDVVAADAVAHGLNHFLGSDTTTIVCFPTCSEARQIIPQHQQEFGTLAEAFAAGYRPCRHCRPAA